MNHAFTVTWRISGFGPNAAPTTRSLRSLLDVATSCSRTQGWQSRSLRPGRNYHVPASHTSVLSPTKSFTRAEHRSYQEQGHSISTRGLATKPKKSIKGTNPARARLEPRPAVGIVPGKLSKVTDASIKTLFGKDVTQSQGNAILSRLHARRLDGTLDHEEGDPSAAPKQVERALSYLRRNFPMNEDAAIMRRIEKEDRDSYLPQSAASHASRHAESQFEKLRNENIAKWEAEQAKKKKAEAEQPAPLHTGTLVERAKSQAKLNKKEKSELMKKWEARARFTEGDQVPEMTNAQRLVPTTVFCVVCIAGCLFFAMNYEPPPRVARLFPDVPPAAATIITLTVINLMGFCMWKIPPFWRFMNKYTLLIAATPNAVSAIGNVFSHQSVQHLLTNMVVLWFVGTRVHDEIGRGNFMAIYISCGLTASLLSLTTSVFKGAWKNASLGASGSIGGIVACYLWLHAWDQLRIILPMENPPSIPGIGLLGIVLALEIFSIRSGKNLKVDNWSHLGGMLGGLAGAEMLKYKRKRVAAEKLRRAAPFLRRG